ncbi:hypothetical protein EC988_001904 [Linderina pennispora]|nr:hypothetical protein EC988_001904 [Linderina pennispora]
MLHSPPPRGNKQWYGTCSAGSGCKGPCDSAKADAPFNDMYVPKKYVKRGSELTVGWDRLNHPGGFVRLAMVPFNQSDSWSAFNENVLKYTCYETNCGPSDPNHNSFGHLNGPGNAPCSTKVTVPKNIPDNTAVTLQWIWYGGGIYYGEKDTSFGEYYGCSDMIVAGGEFADAKPEPTFQGGDVTYPNTDTCKYWGSNKVGDCNFGDKYPSPKEGDLLSQSLEPCMRGPEKQGKPAGISGSSPAPSIVPHAAAVDAPVTSSSAAAPATTEAAPAYSSEAAPASSSEVAPASSSKAAPAYSSEAAPASSSEAAPATSEAAPATSASAPADNYSTVADEATSAPVSSAASNSPIASASASKCIPRPTAAY